LPTSILVRAFAALTAFVLVGCSPDCMPESSCFPAGTYIDANEQLGATSAEICFDTDCTTFRALEGPHDIFTGFNSGYWQEGRTFQLRITVFDAGGQPIDSLAETRTMDSSGCACGVLFYVWKNGHLDRIN
jgi:hypothetical protein